MKLKLVKMLLLIKLVMEFHLSYKKAKKKLKLLNLQALLHELACNV